MKIKLVIKYNDKYYHQPDCYLLIAPDGEISLFARIDDKFQQVKGEIVNIVFVPG